MIKKYNKLVRDRIPEIIEASGKKCVAEILSDVDYLRLVDAKLDEELAEYHKDQNIEELADLLEVIYAAAIGRGYTLEQLEEVRTKKAAERGSFTKKILLKKVIDMDAQPDLADQILTHRQEILAELDEKSLRTYQWLQENLHCRNVAVDEEYRRRFGGYYGMRFVSQKYRDAYFQFFEAHKNDASLSFIDAAMALYPVDNKHEFSFISKMLHTINPSHPIYDSRVERVLKLGHGYGQSLDQRLAKDVQILERLTCTYQELYASGKLTDLLNEIDAVTPGFQMSMEKKMDFIIWALGSI